jgi:hypothetical protein
MPKRDFAEQISNSGHSNQFHYDLDFDKDLIESSFAAQYGIRLRQEPDITLAEFLSLLSGLGGDTPLGRVVAVRMEKNPKAIKEFGVWEKKVRAEWISFKASNPLKFKNPEIAEDSIENLQNALAKMFGGG